MDWWELYFTTSPGTSTKDPEPSTPSPSIPCFEPPNPQSKSSALHPPPSTLTLLTPCSKPQSSKLRSPISKTLDPKPGTRGGLQHPHQQEKPPRPEPPTPNLEPEGAFNIPTNKNCEAKAREYFDVQAHGTPGVSDPNGYAAKCPEYDVASNIHPLAGVAVHTQIQSPAHQVFILSPARCHTLSNPRLSSPSPAWQAISCPSRAQQNQHQTPWHHAQSVI
jgi:hypothetical protein